jgi:hypothetical protein
MPERLAVERRRARVMNMLHTLPATAQEAIVASLGHAGADPGYRTQAVPGAGVPVDAGGEPPGSEPTRPGRWRRFLDAPPGTSGQEQAAGEAGDDQAEDPRGWPPHWPGGRRRS